MEANKDKVSYNYHSDIYNFTNHYLADSLTFNTVMVIRKSKSVIIK